MQSSHEKINSGNTSQDSGWDTLYRDQAIKNDMTAPERFRQEKANGGRLIQDITVNERWDTRYRNEAINNGMTAAMRFASEKVKGETDVDPEEVEWYQAHPDKIGSLIGDGDIEKEQWYREHPDKIWQLIAEKNNRKKENSESETVNGRTASIDYAESDVNATDDLLSPKDEDNLPEAIEASEATEADKSTEIDDVAKVEEFAEGADEVAEVDKSTDVGEVIDTANDKENKQDFSEEDKNRLAGKLERAVRDGKMSLQHAEMLAEKQLGRPIATPEQDEAYFTWLKQHDEGNIANLNRPDRNTRVVNVKYGRNGEVWRDTVANVIDDLKNRIESGKLNVEDRKRIVNFLEDYPGNDGASFEKEPGVADNGSNVDEVAEKEKIEAAERERIEAAEREAIEAAEREKIEAAEREKIEAAEEEAKKSAENGSELDEKEDSGKPEKKRRSLKERLREIGKRLKEIAFGRDEARKQLDDVTREIEQIEEKRGRNVVGATDEVTDDSTDSVGDGAEQTPENDFDKAREIYKKMKVIDAERSSIAREIEELKKDDSDDAKAKLEQLQKLADEKYDASKGLWDEMHLYIHGAEEFDRIRDEEA